jgi:hypothetical protein
MHQTWRQTIFTVRNFGRGGSIVLLFLGVFRVSGTEKLIYCYFCWAFPFTLFPSFWHRFYLPLILLDSYWILMPQLRPSNINALLWSPNSSTPLRLSNIECCPLFEGVCWNIWMWTIVHTCYRPFMIWPPIWPLSRRSTVEHLISIIGIPCLSTHTWVIIRPFTIMLSLSYFHIPPFLWPCILFKWYISLCRTSSSLVWN